MKYGLLILAFTQAPLAHAIEFCGANICVDDLPYCAEPQGFDDPRPQIGDFNNPFAPGQTGDTVITTCKQILSGDHWFEYKVDGAYFKLLRDRTHNEIQLWGGFHRTAPDGKDYHWDYNPASIRVEPKSAVKDEYPVYTEDKKGIRYTVKWTEATLGYLLEVTTITYDSVLNQLRIKDDDKAVKAEEAPGGKFEFLLQCAPEPACLGPYADQTL
jgi:hypothetical protein